MVTTPLQKAAQKALHQMKMENWNWASTASTAEKRSAHSELRKALDAEIAQSVEPEPVAWMRDWSPDEEIVDTDVVTTDYNEAHSPTMDCHNIRPLPAPTPATSHDTSAT